MFTDLLVLSRESFDLIVANSYEMRLALKRHIEELAHTGNRTLAKTRWAKLGAYVKNGRRLEGMGQYRWPTLTSIKKQKAADRWSKVRQKVRSKHNAIQKWPSISSVRALAKAQAIHNGQDEGKEEEGTHERKPRRLSRLL